MVYCHVQRDQFHTTHFLYVLILLLAFFFALNLKHVTSFEDSEM